MPYYAFSLLRARWTGKGRGGWSWRELELIFRLTDRMHCTSCLLIGQDTDAVLSYATTANSRVRVEKSESLILGNVRDFDLIILQDWKQDMADSRFLPVPFQKNKGEQIYLFNLRTGPCLCLAHKTYAERGTNLLPLLRVQKYKNMVDYSTDLSQTVSVPQIRNPSLRAKVKK